MADFKLRAPPRLRFHGLASFDGVFGTGGTIALAGDAVARAVGQAALLRGINLAGAGVASSQATSALLKGLRLSAAGVSGAVGSGALSASGGSAWEVGSINLLVGVSGQPAGQFDISTTGPSGYATGGVYDVDAAGAALPAGMTLSSSGVIDVGSAVVGTTGGIIPAYAEPGAYPSVTLHPAMAGTNTLPYMATWFPNEGVVPSGFNVVSPDDANLRGAILSRWPDNSAAVIAIAGETAVIGGTTKGIRLRVGQPSSTPLTTARINAIVSTIKVNFGGGEQTLTLSGATPDRVWWATPQLICARYRLSCGLGVMEAVIDIHAFKSGASDRAFVEVVVENSAIDADQAAPTLPTSQTYSGATVKVNDVTIATVSTPVAASPYPNSRLSGNHPGGHRPLRAWYCSTWLVGTPGVVTAADPQIEVTHDTASLAAHPWFFRKAESSTENLATKYAQSYDTYVPFAHCRLRIPDMSSGSADEEISLFTLCQTDYLQSGDRYARRAVLATGLACLSANINWRDSAGGSPSYEVPSQAQLNGKNSGTGWPRDDVEPGWGGPSQTNDGSHIPAVALVPFLCRPSPVFIEIAQKEFCWNSTNFSSSVNGTHPYDQLRSRAWRARNCAIAAFLTPDADSTRKDGYRTVLKGEHDIVRAMLDRPFNSLGALWEWQVQDGWNDNSSTRSGYQTAFYQHNFVVMAYNAIAAAKVLRGADAAAFEATANDVCEFVVRWINDAPGYEWLVLPYQPTIGVRTGNSIDMSPGNLSTLTTQEMSGSPPSAPGLWKNLFPDVFNYGSVGAGETAADTGYEYTAQYHFALAVAVERDVPNASAAWDRMVAGVSNFSTWRQGFRTRPRWNRWPRNKA